MDDLDFELDDLEFDNWLNDYGKTEEEIEEDKLFNDCDLEEEIIRPNYFGGDKVKKDKKVKIDKKDKPLPLKFCEYEPQDKYVEEFLSGKTVIQLPFFKLVLVDNRTCDWVRYFKTIKYLNKEVKPYIIVAVLKSFLPEEVLTDENYKYFEKIIYSEEEINIKDTFTKKRKLIFNNTLLRQDYCADKKQINEYKEKYRKGIVSILNISKGEQTTKKVVDCYNNYSKDVEDIAFKLTMTKQRVYKILSEQGLVPKPSKKSKNDIIKEYIDDKLSWGKEVITNKSIVTDLNISPSILSKFYKKYTNYKDKILLFNNQLE